MIAPRTVHSVMGSTRTSRAEPSSELLSQSEPHDFVRVLTAWRCHSGLILTMVMLSLVLAASWICLAAPLYTAKATIAIDPRKRLVLQNTAVLADMATDSPAVDTQAQLLRSRVVLGRAAAALAEAGAFTRMPYRTADTPARIDALSAAFKVQRVGLTSALELKFTADDPVLAASAVNAIAAAYIEYQQELKAQATRQANRWLREQVNESQQLLNEVNTTANRYRTKSGLIGADGAGPADSLAAGERDQVSTAQRDVSSARTRLLAAESALRTQGAAAAAQVIDTPGMRELRTKYASTAEHKAHLAATLGVQHPQLQEAEQQLSDLRLQLEAEAHRSIEDLRAQLTFAENRLAASQRNSALLGSQLALDSQARVRLGGLDARAQPIRQMYEALLNRLQQTMAQQSLDQVNVAVVSAAPIPLRPSNPNRELIFSVAVAIGCGAAFLTAFLLDVFDSRVWRQADFERRTRVPIIATVPELRRSDLRIDGTPVALTEVVSADPSGKFADAIRRARLALPEPNMPDGCLVVQYTSATFREGTTLCALAFAQTAAADGHRVIVIDADARRASLTRALDVSADKGLLEVLAGTATLAETIQLDRTMHLHVLPLSKYDLPSRDLLSSRRFDALLEQLRERFDLVVVDTPPLLGVADALAVASRVDAVVITARWAVTGITLVERAFDAVRRVNGHVAGVVLTRVSASRIAQTGSMHALHPVANDSPAARLESHSRNLSTC